MGKPFGRVRDRDFQHQALAAAMGRGIEAEIGARARRERDGLRAGHELRDAERAAEQAEPGEAEQRARRIGQLAEAVLDLLGEGVHRGGVGEAGEAAVEFEAYVRLGDEIGRQMGREVEGDLRAPFGREGFAARRRERADQQMAIELGADQAEMAGLLLAEQVAGAAQVEIGGADRESGAELVECREPVEALARPALPSGCAGSVSS